MSAEELAMPKVTVRVCSRCGLKSCDGAVWKIVSCANIKTGEYLTYKIQPPNLTDCTKNFFARREWKALASLPVGERVVRNFLNWTPPSKVILEKVGR